MPHVLILHEVADYSTWKAVFDGVAGLRHEAGERSCPVFRAQDDANRIVHLSPWTSPVAARTFFDSPELVRIRRDVGVRAPEFIYLDEVESGTL